MTQCLSILKNLDLTRMETKKILFYTAASLATAYVGFKWVKSFLNKKRLRKAIRNRRHERNSVIEQLRMKLELADDDLIQKRQWITSMNLNDLINELQLNNIGPVEVLEAFQWRAILSNDLTNCVCQFIVEANDWAEELEQKYHSSDNKPPLYGVPISVKESIQIKGYDSTRGYAKEIGQTAQTTNHLVTLLQEYGAIPFARTNVPQSLLSFNCSNPVYGRTSNPADVNRTCGGSTGGEAALIATRGSVLGIGGDVGGSIRIPSHFCGIAGFKPSHLRICQLGSKASVPGRPMLCASIGPMANDVDSLALFLKLLLCPDMYEFDPYVAPIPFRDELYREKSDTLTVGYYDFDGFMPATPSCQRAVRVAKEILEKAGHKLIRFAPPNVEEAFGMFIGAATVDGGRYLVNQMKNDIVDPYYLTKIRLYSFPIWLKRILRPLINVISPDFGMAFKGLSLDTSELREVYEKIGNYRQTFIRQWHELGVDAIICPPVASSALLHENPELCSGAVSYSMLFNLLDFPAGVVPVTRVSTNDEKNMAQSYVPNRFYAKIIKDDSSSNTVGLAVGVQCASLPFNEEICLRIMKDIESGVKKSGY